MAEESKLATLYVEVKAKADQLEKDLNALKNKTATAGKQMETNLGKSSSGFSLMSMKAIAATAAVGALTAVVKKSIQEYASKEAALSKLTSALGKYSQKLAEQADVLERNSKFTDDQVLSAQALLAEYVKSEDQIAQLIPGITDLATALNMDLEQAAQMVGKTISGDINAFKRYGFEITGAAGSTEKLNSMLEFLATKQGRAKDSTETTAGKIDQFNKSIDNVYTNIGQALVPAIDSIGTSLSGLVKEGESASEFFKLITFAALNAAGAINTIVAGLKNTVALISGAFKISQEILKGNQAGIIIEETALYNRLKEINTDWFNNYVDINKKIFNTFSDSGNKIVDKNLEITEKLKKQFKDAGREYVEMFSSRSNKKTVIDTEIKTDAYDEEKNKIIESYELKKSVATKELKNSKNLKTSLARIEKQYKEDLRKLDESYGLIEESNTSKSSKTKEDIQKEYYDRVTFLSDDYYQYRVKQINDEVALYLKATKDKNGADLLRKTLVDGLNRERKDFIKQQEDATEYGKAVKQKVEADEELNTNYKKNISARAGLYKEDSNAYLIELKKRAQEQIKLFAKRPEKNKRTEEVDVVYKPDEPELTKKTQVVDVIYQQKEPAEQIKSPIKFEFDEKGFTEEKKKTEKSIVSWLKDRKKEIFSRGFAIPQIKTELEVDATSAYDANKILTDIEKAELTKKTQLVEVIVQRADESKVGEIGLAKTPQAIAPKERANGTELTEEQQRELETQTTFNDMRLAAENAYYDGLVTLMDTFWQGIRLSEEQSKNWLIAGFTEMANSFISQVKRMAAEWLAFQAIKGILNFFTGGLVGGIASVASAAAGHSGGTFVDGNKTPLALAGGGSFIVPQGFQNDSFPMLVESGEKVSVTPRSAVTAGTDNKLLSSIAGKLDALNMNLANKNFTSHTTLSVDGKKLATTMLENINELKRTGLNTDNI